MTMITLEQEISETETTLAEIREELRRARGELQAYRKALEASNGEETSLQLPDVKKITSLVNVCFDTENRLEKCKAQHAGIAQCGVAFDLNAARTSIGCKLDSLRRCSASDPVSE